MAALIRANPLPAYFAALLAASMYGFPCFGRFFLSGEFEWRKSLD